MTDRPIIFSAPMVRALLEGRKTQTRRVLNPQPPCDEETGRPFSGAFHGPEWYTSTAVDRHGEEVPGKEVFGIYSDDWGLRIPYAPGDRLYVREAFAKVGDIDDDIHACPDLRIHAYYRADAVDPERQRWRSPIHMPRWASRLTLTVTEVRVQRLQEISEADAVAEGAMAEYGEGAAISHRRAFNLIWNSLHGPDAWDKNPWVVAVTFTVQRGNIDQIGRSHA